MGIAFRYRSFRRTTFSAILSRNRDGFIGQVCCHHLGWQCHPVLHRCAAFILVTSLFLMQNGGIQLSLSTMILWLFISVLSAVGNAGVPMGCYFLTLSLMSGMNAPIGIMGIILPIYTIIDMIETAENVWSDSCVCAMVDKDMQKSA